MKIADILKENKHNNSDWDNEENEIVDDPDSDRVPHLVMQFKKAIDNGGRSPIIFKDGDKVSIPLSLIAEFLNAYDDLKPFEREDVQRKALQSVEDFKNALRTMKSRAKAPKSIYR